MATALIETFKNHIHSANDNLLIFKTQDNIKYKKYTQYLYDDKNKDIYDNIHTISNAKDAKDVKDVKDVRHNTEPVMFNVKHIVQFVEPIDSGTSICNKNNQKKNNIKPYDIILNETNTILHDIEHIKGRIYDLISYNNFIKIFGKKKSAEAMSGIVNNRWNKSVALLISFMFDKIVNYNGTDIVYNKDNIKGSILVNCRNV